MQVQKLETTEMAHYNATHRVIITAADINGNNGAAAASYGANGPGVAFGALSAAAAASTTGTLNPFNSEIAGVMSQFVSGFLKTKFSGTSTTDLAITIGYTPASGPPAKIDGFESLISIHASGSFVTYFPQEIADQSATGINATWGTVGSAALTSAIGAINALIKTIRKVFAVANTVQVNFTATGANLTDLINGELHLYFRLQDFNQI
jgi:hypothetical protein